MTLKTPITFWVISVAFDLVALLSSNTTQGHFFAKLAFYAILLGVITAVPILTKKYYQQPEAFNNTQVTVITSTCFLLMLFLFTGYLVQLLIRYQLLEITPNQASVSNCLAVFNLAELTLLLLSTYLGETLKKTA